MDDGNEDWLSKLPAPKDSFDCEKEERGEEEEEDEEIAPTHQKAQQGAYLY
ncbi:MAG: hypothetical protein P0116_10725 [Candidatus Nitrosocosmicus sp.]|nr:hypothetical protein [Candidatus Nitrosocosmicus sp.]